MSATKLIGAVSIFIFVATSNTAVAFQAKKSMPPMFSVDQKPEVILSTYQLGVLNKQEAFSHHGGPIRKLKLPNGNTGWLYSVGEDYGIPNVYVLQFSKDGVVTDVLHKSLHYKNGHSALQYQFLQKITPELLMLGPGPGEQ